MSAELLSKLIEAGTPAALVAEVALELGRAQAVQEVAEKKRAYDREYQRERRKNRTTSYDTNDIADPSPLKVSPQTPLPKTPNQISPLNPPVVLEEKRAAIASCLRLAFPPPQGVGEEQWAAFCKQRRKKLNDRSYLLLTNKLAKLEADGWPAGEMIDRAIESGWETVFAPTTKGQTETKRYVSKSGYEYRGGLDQVQAEAKRRSDWDTYWGVEVDRKKSTQAVGDVANDILRRVG